MTNEERIANLRRGIASASTPDHLKASMQEQLDVLLAPPPPPAPKPKPRPAAKPKPVTPPPPPARTFTAGEKEERRRQLEERIAKKKARQ